MKKNYSNSFTYRDVTLENRDKIYLYLKYETENIKICTLYYTYFLDIYLMKLLLDEKNFLRLINILKEDVNVKKERMYFFLNKMYIL